VSATVLAALSPSSTANPVGVIGDMTIYGEANDSSTLETRFEEVNGSSAD